VVVGLQRGVRNSRQPTGVTLWFCGEALRGARVKWGFSLIELARTAACRAVRTVLISDGGVGVPLGWPAGTRVWRFGGKGRVGVFVGG